MAKAKTARNDSESDSKKAVNDQSFEKQVAFKVTPDVYDLIRALSCIEERKSNAMARHLVHQQLTNLGYMQHGRVTALGKKIIKEWE